MDAPREVVREPAPDPRFAPAWWCAVVEPGDPHAFAIRHALGDEEAMAWALADHAGPLPPQMAVDPHGRDRGFDAAWARWHPRAVAADPVRDLDELARLGGRLVVPDGPGWPEALDDLGAERPHALWALGTEAGSGVCAGAPGVALVGSRAATSYGEHVAADLALELAEQGVDVVSGGAFGIDAAAHRGALAARSGHTTVMMAGGLAHLYPRAHADLFDQVRAGGGVILSEVPPSWRPARWRFLGRNRVIAALGQAAVVVEASERSGALATARRAMELGRHVGAVPGPVTSESARGCHLLLRQGATLVRDAADVAQMLAGFAGIGAEPIPGAPVARDVGSDAWPAHHRRVWEALPARGGAPPHRLVRASGLSARDVLSALGRLQLEGHVDMRDGQWFRRTVR